ncbi:MAG: prepilin-type N-terminal cleavage/methylation domain-containing protein [Phycisphaerales bacterium]|nr:prepilin-type N-terminal cleavage/methylation domain-containing protein [Phycisphaerales bacterium]
MFRVQNRAVLRWTGRRTAFTLVEVLVVISIIALLLAILLPSLRSARDQAKRIVCGANVRAIGQGVWNYWTERNGRVPYIISPMTNGGALSATGPAIGFGDPAVDPASLDPFDRERWPTSLPNVLMPSYMNGDPRVFVCPAAVMGWPRGGPYRYTYRPAAANQPNGAVAPENSYLRDNFGMLDGRMFKTLGNRLTGNVVRDSQLMAFHRSTFLRDMVKRTPITLEGPHRKGINVLDRRLNVQYRSHAEVVEDLNAFGTGAQF